MIKFIKLCLAVLLLSAVVAMSAVAEESLTLHYAAMKNDYVGAAKLIKKGFDVNEPFAPNRFTPLHFAAIHGSLETALVLLKNGAYVNNATNDLGITPLHFAAMKNFFEIAVVLLKNGADASITDIKGGTAFMIAVRAKSWGVAGLLEEK